MSIATFSAVVENGQIRLPENVRLPEKATVYVIVPGITAQSFPTVLSPRLAHPEQAVDFVKTVEELRDAHV